jgi:serine protease Do
VKITEKGEWPHVELGSSIALKRGDPCILLGYPFAEFPGGLWDTNRRPAIRTGAVVDTADMTGIFKTWCRFSPGFSGGGLFDLDGRLVGVHEGGDSERGPARHRRIELVRIQWDFLAAAKPHDTVATNAPNPITEAFREVVRGVPPIAVEVIGDNKRRAWGTIIGSDGWILTKASELYGSLSCRLPDGRNLTAVVRGTSPDHDLALLKVNAENLPAARWSERDEIPVGTLVAALGCGEPPRVGTVYHPAHPIPREASRLWGGTIRDGQGGVEIYDPPGQEESPLQPGDVITDVETHPTPDSNAFFKLAQEPNVGVPSVIAGDPIRVGVRRGKTTLELRFPLPAQDGTNPESQSHRRSAFPSVFTTDMVILPNQCGGPVVNESGFVVGITIARPYSDEGRIYVIPAVVARQVVKDLGSPNANREKGK